MKQISKLVAERTRIQLGELKRRYKEKALIALSRNPTNKSYYSVFLHLCGHLRDSLSENERRYALKLLEDLKNEKTDIRVIISYFKGFVYRFNDEYLAGQRFLQPYPEDLD